MPGSVGNTGLAGNHAVKCCRAVLLYSDVIRLKIWLNFVAARDVPIPSDNDSIRPTAAISYSHQRKLFSP